MRKTVRCRQPPHFLFHLIIEQAQNALTTKCRLPILTRFGRRSICDSNRFVVIATVLASAARAGPVAADDFYKGKSIRVIVAAAPAAASISIPGRWRATWGNIFLATRIDRREYDRRGNPDRRQIYSQQRQARRLYFGIFNGALILDALGMTGRRFRHARIQYPRCAGTGQHGLRAA